MIISPKKDQFWTFYNEINSFTDFDGMFKRELLFLYFLICLFSYRKKNNSNKSKTYAVWIK